MVLTLLAAACSLGQSPVDGGRTDGPTASVANSRQETASTSGEGACTGTTGTDGDLAAEVVSVARSAMKDSDLRAVLVSVSRDGEELATASLGQSTDGVPAEPGMRFFNGAVVFAYMGVVMLQLDDEGVLDIDEPIEQWVPDVPGGEEITPRMLMSSMSGLRDFETMDSWLDTLYDNPFRPFTTSELEAYVYDDSPLLYEPGTNVSYSHLAFRLAGAVIETAAGEPLADVLEQRVLSPLGLHDTESVETVEVEGPVLRTFTNERTVYEESTGWSPAWGVPAGGMQVTSICDLRRSAAGIGSGELLAEPSFDTFLDPGTVGQGEVTEGCESCIPQTEELHFGMGVTVAEDWIIQTPLFTGIASIQAYAPSAGLAIAVANTYGPEGDVDTNASTSIFVELAELLAPEAAVPRQIR